MHETSPGASIFSPEAEQLPRAVAAMIVSIAALALLSNVLLKSMDAAWEESKQAMEREKQAFREVILAMYPAGGAVHHTGQPVFLASLRVPERQKFLFSQKIRARKQYQESCLRQFFG